MQIMLNRFRDEKLVVVESYLSPPRPSPNQGAKIGSAGSTFCPASISFNGYYGVCQHGKTTIKSL